MSLSRPAVSVLSLSLALAACGSPDVVAYVAVDQEHSEQLIRKFEQETGLKVKAQFDTESSKTVGLVNELIEEQARPRCDVFWNNELAHTVRLMQKGLLEPYASPSGAGIPAQWRDPAGNWHGFAARARILIVNKDRLPDPKDWPRSVWDLIDPKWKGKCAVAKPLTGTTLTHFTALSTVLPAADFQRLIEGLFRNEVVLLAGNAATMKQVAEGHLDWAFTDSDDYHVGVEKGYHVAAVFPDQQDGGLGTMLIPNSVSIVKGAPHPEAAKKLVDWILSERTEGLLAASKSAQIPLRPGVKGPGDPSILAVDKFRAMKWDPAAVAQSLDKMSAEFGKRFP
jgi:iron(III) transport system substrate-binding protein